MQTIGFVGLGNIGLPIAQNLRKAGYPLIVSDLRKECTDQVAGDGVTVATSILKMANSVETIFASLPTPPVVEAVVAGESGILNGSKVRRVVNLSTSGSQLSVKLSGLLATRGIALIDAPVSGGVGGARAGKLTLMASGPKSTFEEVRTLLEAMGKVIFVGEQAGLGQSMKLVNNILAGGALVLTAEAMVVGAKAGLAADVMIDVLNSGSGRNSGTADKFPKSVLTGTFDYGFAASLMAKDNKLFLDEAESMGLSLRASTAVWQMWREMIDDLGDGDFTNIARLMEKRAGVELRSSPQN